MPIYEFQCRRCRQSFEQIILSASEKVVCPKCHSAAVEKQLSVFSSPGSAPAEASGDGCGCTPQTRGCR